MNRETLLAILPASTGYEQTIVDEQTVRDIVKEVLDAHDVFAGDYDLICNEFSYRNYRATLKGLFDFCKRNIRNDTEGEDLQTTRSPASLMERGHCDCKGYAGFIGGVLDALNRQGYNYKWCYRFAQYDEWTIEGKVIHYHVFIVAKLDGEEIWIDPVLDEFNQKEPVPDRFFDRKKSSMTLVRMSGINQPTGHQVTGAGAHFSMGCPAGAGQCNPLGGYATMGLINLVIAPSPSTFAQLTPAGTALAATNLAAANAASVTTTGAQTAASSGELVFKEARAGLLLPAIPGYPSDLPQLQLTPSGRLCFYNWPLTLTNAVWTDLSTHKSIAGPFSTLDWTNTYLRIGTLDNVGQAAYNQLKADFTSGMDPFDFSYYNTSPGLAAGWYKLGRPEYWIFQNVQYYIDRYLKNPYGVNALISYGTNWCDQFKAAIMGGQTKLKTYLEGCNFLVQPVGTQGFWDKFYLAAPLIISAAAAIVTAGAATPALLLAISNVAIKAGEAQAALTAARTLTPQGTPIINAANVTTDVTTLQGGSAGAGSSTLSASGLLAWIEQNPLPAVGIGGALLLILYGLLNKD